MVARIHNVRTDVLVRGPKIVLSAVAVGAAIVQITVLASQVPKAGNRLWLVVIDAKVEVGAPTIRLSTIHANAAEIALQPAFIGLVAPECTRLKLSNMP